MTTLIAAQACILARPSCAVLLTVWMRASSKSACFGLQEHVGTPLIVPCRQNFDTNVCNNVLAPIALVHSRSPKNSALQQLRQGSKSGSTTPERPIWTTSGTDAVREFLENGCNSYHKMISRRCTVSATERFINMQNCASKCFNNCTYRTLQEFCDKGAPCALRQGSGARIDRYRVQVRPGLETART